MLFGCANRKLIRIRSMKKILCAAAVITFLQFTICSSHAGFFDKLLGGGASTNSSSVSSAVSALSQDQVATALKEALGNGLQLAVSTLGHNDGFLTNLEVKIPLPQKLQSAEKMLHALKRNFFGARRKPIYTRAFCRLCKPPRPKPA
jgi:hypothetical protein